MSYFSGRFISVLSAVSIGFIMGSPSSAIAQKAARQAESDWDISLGAGVIYGPEYEGSSSYEASPLPYINIRYKDRYYLGAEGLGADFFQGDNFKVGAALGYDGGREGDGNLQGMGDVDATALMKIYGEYKTGLFKLGLKTEFDLLSAGHEGLLLTPSLGIGGFMPKYRLIYNVSAEATYADDNYMQNMFGVTASQAAATSFTAYQPKHGFKSIGLNGMVSYMFDKNWAVTGIAGVSQLIGEAADSPIVQDKMQYSTGMFISYRF